MYSRKEVFKKGMHDAIPIMLGYFAVGFSLGIAAKNAGLTPFQGFVTSFLGNASAGEYVAFSIIAAQGTYLEMAIGTLITNARYLLMSASLTQKIDENTSLFHRMLVAFDITDELFGLGIANIASYGPFYMYGAYLMAIPGWSLGTMFGVIAGNLLPGRIVSALSVALFGMFMAIIIPPCKNDSKLRILVLLSFAISFLWDLIPFFQVVSSGTKTIILTLIISSGAALLWPRKEDDNA